MTQAMNNSYHHSHILEMAKERLLLEDFLVKKSDLSLRDSEGRNALFWAIKYKNRYNIEVLIKNNISLMVKPDLHALFHAVDSDDYGTVKELLEKKLDVNMLNDKGQTLLMKAIEAKAINIIRLLIYKHNVDLYLMDNEHNMAIDYAKSSKNMDIENIVYYRMKYVESQEELSNCGSCATLCNDNKES